MKDADTILRAHDRLRDHYASQGRPASEEALLFAAMGDLVTAILADAQKAAPPAAALEVLDCGHAKHLLLTSAETGLPLYCELCDLRQQRDDAVLREQELAEQVRLLSDALRDEHGPTFMCEPVLPAKGQKAAPPAAQPDERAALQAIMRAADAAKEPCGLDPESAAAIRNGKFASIAQMAAQGLGLVRGPTFAAQVEPAPAPDGFVLVSRTITPKLRDTLLQCESGEFSLAEAWSRILDAARLAAQEQTK